MPPKSRVVLKKGRNPGRVPTNVNKTGKPPGAKKVERNQSRPSGEGKDS